MKFKHITTEAKAEAYEATDGVFSAILSEVRELSKKKPDAMLTAAKVKIVNRMLVDLLAFLRFEPEGKYLEPLDDDALPQASDALLNMAQFRAALDAFRRRYTWVDDRDEEFWVTPERVAEREADGVLDDDDDDDDDDDVNGDDDDDSSENNDDTACEDDDDEKDEELNEAERWRRWTAGPKRVP